MFRGWLINHVVFLVTVFIWAGCAHQTNKGESHQRPMTLQKIIERGEVVVGTSLAQPPFTFQGKDGKSSGLDISVAQRLADALGVKLQVKSQSFGDLMGSLKRGEVDIILSGLTITPQRNRDVLFARPYFRSHRGFATLNRDIAQGASLEEVVSDEMKIGVLKGSTHERAVRGVNDKANIVYGEHYGALFSMLNAGKIDLVVGEYPSCIVASRLAQQEEAQVVMADTYEPIGAAIRIDDYHFLNWLNNFLNSLEKSGETQRILEGWLKANVWDDW